MEILTVLKSTYECKPFMLAVFLILSLIFLQISLKVQGNDDSYVKNADISNFISKLCYIWMKRLTDFESNHKCPPFIAAVFVIL